MEFIFILILFLLGLFVGSFLNVLVDRLPLGENPLIGRSHCDKCKKTLEARDMIPLFSYIVLSGKCRFCNHKLGLYYPLVEFVTGILFAYTLYYIVATGNIIFVVGLVYVLGLLGLSLIMISTLIVIFFTDLKYGLIPFKAVVIGSLTAVIWHILYPSAHLLLINYILSAIGAFLIFIILFLLTKRKGMGFGDVVYSFYMGLILGFPKILLGLYIAFISGAIISLILVAQKKKKIKGGLIPFGPFLVVGTLISLFWGDFLLSKILPYLLGS